MALVMLCGIPAAGKSTRAHEIAGYFQTRLGETKFKKIHIVDDKLLDIPKEYYNDREREKRARGEQINIVRRLMGENSLVILDNMTYIKGFRYQLYCDAKAAEVVSCVLYVGTPSEKAAEFNHRKSSIDPERVPWPKDLFDALVFRFEEPNGMNRWDSPLFIALPGEELPKEEIFDALVNKQPPKPNAATHKNDAIGADYLSSLNSITSQITKEVLELYARSPGSSVVLHGQSIQLPYNLTMPQLARIRRNFISVNKQTAMSQENITNFFIEFLIQNWNLVT